MCLLNYVFENRLFVHQSAVGQATNCGGSGFNKSEMKKKREKETFFALFLRFSLLNLFDLRKNFSSVTVISFRVVNLLSCNTRNKIEFSFLNL